MLHICSLRVRHGGQRKTGLLKRNFVHLQRQAFAMPCLMIGEAFHHITCRADRRSGKAFLRKTMTETEQSQMYFNMSFLKAGAKIIQKTKQTSRGTSEAHKCWTQQNPMPPVAHVY